MTYEAVYDSIKAALSEREAGTRVQVSLHEQALLDMLTYIEQLREEISMGGLHEAHEFATADANCNLVWNIEFADTDYSYVVGGFDGQGNPLEIQLIEKETGQLVIKTLVDGQVFAIARTYGGIEI